MFERLELSGSWWVFIVAGLLPEIAHDMGVSSDGNSLVVTGAVNRLGAADEVGISTD
jgi:hypothetical protein